MQERVRERLPLYEPGHEVTVEAEAGGPNPRASAIPVYRFRDPLQHYVLSLVPDFYALSTSNYTHWEDFRVLVTYVSEAVRAVYSPAFALRIGLPYINFLDQTTTGYASLPDITALVRPELGALLGLDAVSDPDLAIHYIRASNWADTLALRSGVVTDPQKPGPTFVLDFDASCETQSSLDSVLETCERYHSTVYDAFRWAIRPDRLAVFGIRGTE